MAQRNPQNFNAMRQDAIRRSREMHRRADPGLPPQPEAPVPPPAPPPPPPPAPSPSSAPPPPKPARSPLGDLSGILEGLHLSDELHGLLTDWDGEKLALAGMLYLLWKEGSDPVLLIAMAYILL